MRTDTGEACWLGLMDRMCSEAFLGAAGRRKLLQAWHPGGRGGIASLEQPPGPRWTSGAPASGERDRGWSKIEAWAREAPDLDCEHSRRGRKILKTPTAWQKK
ncbi:hypothetical protein NDU88_008003 [Pleurodeles waltl]|uniref:Uncharacterized protein n=1 Tax=Pleurodeles waltl TaxID=8319 RepID=A0AAV7QNP6_PLEWA|nr:hypothetical protein NDU88_008003 [Pleurodeles waltl]